MKKGITTEESLKIIEDAAENGVTVVKPGTQVPTVPSSGSTTKVAQPKVSVDDAPAQSLSNVVRTAQAAEKARAAFSAHSTTSSGVPAGGAGGAPVNRGAELLRQAQAKNAVKPMIDLTK